MYVDEETRKWAIAGDNVSLSLTHIEDIQVSVGFVLCDPESPIPLTTHFKAQIIVFDVSQPLVGDDLVFIQGSLKEEARISRMVSILDKNNNVIKNNPRMLSKNVSAIIEVRLKRSICCESFKDSKDFGRFLLRCKGESVAAGIVLEILSFDKGDLSVT